MGQRIQPWQFRDGGSSWLSMLVDTMDEIARPEFRGQPCDRAVLARVSAQLARPAPAYPRQSSDSHLRY